MKNRKQFRRAVSGVTAAAMAVFSSPVIPSAVISAEEGSFKGETAYVLNAPSSRYAFAEWENEDNEKVMTGYDLYCDDQESHSDDLFLSDIIQKFSGITGKFTTDDFSPNTKVFLQVHTYDTDLWLESEAVNVHKGLNTLSVPEVFGNYDPEHTQISNISLIFTLPSEDGYIYILGNNSASFKGDSPLVYTPEWEDTITPWGFADWLGAYWTGFDFYADNAETDEDDLYLRDIVNDYSSVTGSMLIDSFTPGAKVRMRLTFRDREGEFCTKFFDVREGINRISLPSRIDNELLDAQIEAASFIFTLPTEDSYVHCLGRNAVGFEGSVPFELSPADSYTMETWGFADWLDSEWTAYFFYTDNSKTDEDDLYLSDLIKNYSSITADMFIDRFTPGTKVSLCVKYGDENEVSTEYVDVKEGLNSLSLPAYLDLVPENTKINEIAFRFMLPSEDAYVHFLSKDISYFKGSKPYEVSPYDSDTLKAWEYNDWLASDWTGYHFYENNKETAEDDLYLSDLIKNYSSITANMFIHSFTPGTKVRLCVAYGDEKEIATEFVDVTEGMNSLSLPEYFDLDTEDTQVQVIAYHFMLPSEDAFVRYISSSDIILGSGDQTYSRNLMYNEKLDIRAINWDYMWNALPDDVSSDKAETNLTTSYVEVVYHSYVPDFPATLGEFSEKYNKLNVRFNVDEVNYVKAKNTHKLKCYVQCVIDGQHGYMFGPYDVNVGSETSVDVPLDDRYVVNKPDAEIGFDIWFCLDELGYAGEDVGAKFGDVLADFYLRPASIPVTGKEEFTFKLKKETKSVIVCNNENGDAWLEENTVEFYSEENEKNPDDARYAEILPDTFRGLAEKYNTFYLDFYIENLKVMEGYTPYFNLNTVGGEINDFEIYSNIITLARNIELHEGHNTVRLDLKQIPDYDDLKAIQLIFEAKKTDDEQLTHYYISHMPNNTTLLSFDIRPAIVGDFGGTVVTVDKDNTLEFTDKNGKVIKGENEYGETNNSISLLVIENKNYNHNDIPEENILRAFDISLRNGEAEVQPNHKIRVYIDAPEGVNPRNTEVIRKEADGTYSHLNTHYDPVLDKLYFETEHCSEYLIAAATNIADIKINKANVSVTYLNSATPVQVAFNDVTKEMVDFMISADNALVNEFVNAFSSYSAESCMKLTEAQMAAVRYVLGL